MTHEQELHQQMDALARNSIFFDFTQKAIQSTGSKLGGRPALPRDCAWPRHTDGQGNNIPLPFLLQLNCEELVTYDLDQRLPHQGMLYLFYDIANEPWENSSGVRLIYSAHPGSEPVDFPDELPLEHRFPEKGLQFSSHPTIPGWEDYLSLSSDEDKAYDDWDIIESRLESWGYPRIQSQGRVLGYASLLQGGIAEVCQSRARGDETPQYSRESAQEWTLLLQLDYIEEEDVTINFGDCGKLYFYIRQSDLAQGDFSQLQFEMQSC